MHSLAVQDPDGMVELVLLALGDDRVPAFGPPW
jgi:hypothetical protein